MTTIRELRALSVRLTIEHNRLQTLADQLAKGGFKMAGFQVRRYALSCRAFGGSLSHIADERRDPRGGRKRA